MRQTNTSRPRGFTLIELLIIIAVIAILASIAFVALNPLGRFRDSRNARRWTDVGAILSAIKLQQLDNGGEYGTDVGDLADGSYYQIGVGDSCNIECNQSVTLEAVCLDLTTLKTSGYLANLPIDPNSASLSSARTGYYVIKQSTGSITVGACFEEQGSNGVTPEISVSR
jgi:prepilin-type N-terminal cleavage/methylation domain-containing protein